MIWRELKSKESGPPYASARSRREGSDSVFICADSAEPSSVYGGEAAAVSGLQHSLRIHPALRTVAHENNQQASQASGIPTCTDRAIAGSSNKSAQPEHFHNRLALLSDEFDSV